MDLETYVRDIQTIQNEIFKYRDALEEIHRYIISLWGQDVKGSHVEHIRDIAHKALKGYIMKNDTEYHLENILKIINTPDYDETICYNLRVYCQKNGLLDFNWDIRDLPDDIVLPNGELLS